MRTTIVLICATLACAALFAADLPFWGDENGEGTNVVATASAVSAVAKPATVRTVCMAVTDSIEVSSYPRGLFICIK